MEQTAQEDRLLTAREAARELRLAPNTLAKWRARERQPLPFIRVGRVVRYRQADLHAYIAAHTET